MSEEDEFSAEELAEAKRFASQVDDVLTGQPLPAIMGVEERNLLKLSSRIHSAHNDAPLGDSRKAAIIEAAIAQAVNIGSADFSPNSKSVSSIADAREKRRLTMPMALGLVVAIAAALVFFWRTPDASQPTEPSVATRELPADELSRTSDAVVGQIDRRQSHHASQRLDLIYGDRMHGYRSLQYRRLVGEK